MIYDISYHNIYFLLIYRACKTCIICNNYPVLYRILIIQILHRKNDFVEVFKNLATKYFC